MHGARILAVFAILTSGYQSTCRSSAGAGTGQKPESEIDVRLAGVDTGALTAREKREWSVWVSELLAPCPSEPVSVATCVRENRACARCLPAAKLLVKQVREGRSRSQAEEAFYLRFSPDRVKTVEVGDAPTLGSAVAPVTIVEWADFQCPHCRHVVPIMEKLVTDHPGQVRFAFKFYPLSGHPQGESTARAAAAAQKQGKFWAMHHALFDHQNALEPKDIEKCAKDVGLDMARFKTDWASEPVADRVSRDRKQGDQLGITGTPTIYINGRELGHAFDAQADTEDWVALEIELIQKGGTPSADAGAAK
jgi:predicted DsbA family dithiol-disulfide isomerase